MVIDSLSVFKHNDIGIYSYGTGSPAPVFTSCTIDSNVTGIYCDGSDADIEDNTIRYNTTNGIYCAGYSDPFIAGNEITNNYNAVKIQNGSEPDIGHTGVSGQNAIYLSDNFLVANFGTATISAEDNWWNRSTGPKTAKLYGSVDYTPWLTSPPLPLFVATLPGSEGKFPKRFALGTISPNPFNPTTTIRYDVPQPGGNVSLRVYDVAGHLVTELVNGFQPAGYHSVTWVGTSRTGRPVASGVYFIQMISPTATQSRKLVLLK